MIGHCPTLSVRVERRLSIVSLSFFFHFTVDERLITTETAHSSAEQFIVTISVEIRAWPISDGPRVVVRVGGGWGRAPDSPVWALARTRRPRDASSTLVQRVRGKLAQSVHAAFVRRTHAVAGFYGRFHIGFASAVEYYNPSPSRISRFPTAVVGFPGKARHVKVSVARRASRIFINVQKTHTHWSVFCTLVSTESRLDIWEPIRSAGSSHLNVKR